MVFSREHGYAGAADAIGYRLDGSAVVVCDFKTSNSTQQSYALQVRLESAMKICFLVVFNLKFCHPSCTLPFLVQLAAYVVAIREMWVAGELDLNALLVAEGGDGSSRAGSAVDPAESSSDAPISATDALPSYSATVRSRTSDETPAVVVPLDAPIFDPLGLSGADAFFSSLASASASSAAPAESSQLHARLVSPSSGSVAAETLSNSRITPIPRGRRSHALPKTLVDDAHSHPVVDEEWLMGAIAAADAAAASARVSAASGGGSALISTRSSTSRAFSTLSLPCIQVAPVSAVDIVSPSNSPATVSVSPNAGLPDFELTSGADPHGAVDDDSPCVQKLALCPRTTPIEAIIVRLDKATGAVDVQRVADIDASFRGFSAALQLHRLLKPRAQSRSVTQARSASLLERVD